MRNEVDRVRAFAGPARSALLGVTEDYGEYRPRGRFGRDGADVGYFQAMTWFGRAGFRVGDPAATRRALLVVRALAADDDLGAAWRRFDDVVTFLVGAPDDPTPADYRRLAARVSGCDGAAAVDAVLADRRLGRAFAAALDSLPSPRVNTAVDQPRGLTRGMRVLGQRGTRDAAVLQQVMEEGTWPPSGLHVVAALLGDAGAARHLGAAAPEVPHPDVSNDPAADLVEGWLACYKPALADDPALPAVFRTRAWHDKQLNSALGAWAETRHASAPYLKAAHVYVGGSMISDRLHGFVEPYPEFFSRLAARMRALDRLLAELGVYVRVEREQGELEQSLDSKYGKPDERGHRDIGRNHRAYYEDSLGKIRLDPGRLPEFAEILDRLADLAESCRDGRAQTPADGIFLKFLRRRLQRLGFNQSTSPVAEESMARVIDVAAEYPSGQVLQVAVGRALPIYVAVPDGDRRVVCRGAIYSYYEFTAPQLGRLTDQMWAALTSRLDGGGDGPWLDRACGLIHHPHLDRDTLRTLSRRHDSEPRGSSYGVCPWTLTAEDRGAEFAGARTDPGDVDLLQPLAADDEGVPDVVLMATSELARHAVIVPAARAFFRDAVDHFLTLPDTQLPKVSPVTAMRLYFAAATLEQSGEAADRDRLDALDSRLAAWPRGQGTHRGGCRGCRRWSRPVAGRPSAGSAAEAGLQHRSSTAVNVVSASAPGLPCTPLSRSANPGRAARNAATTSSFSAAEPGARRVDQQPARPHGGGHRGPAG